MQGNGGKAPTPVPEHSQGDDDDGQATDLGSLKSAAVRATGWLFLDKWLSRLTSMLVFIALGRLLPLHAFGVIALATVVTDFLSMFADQGIGKAVICVDNATQRLLSTAFWICLGTGTFLTVALIATAPVIGHLLGADEVIPVLRVLSMLFIFSAHNSMQKAVLQREFKFRATTIRNVLSSVGGAIVGLSCAFAGAGVWSLVAQSLSVGVIGAAVLWRCSSFRPSLTFGHEEARSVWKFGFGTLGISTLSWFTRNGDNLVVGAFLGPIALGIYSVAYKVLSMITELVVGIVTTASLPLFAKLASNRQATVRAVMEMTRVSSLLAAPVFATVFITAPTMFPYVYGHKWTAAVPLVQVFCIVGLLNCVLNFDRNVLLAAGKPGLELALVAGESSLDITGFLIGVHWGTIGVAAALAIRSYAYWPIRLLALRFTTGMSLRKYLRQWSVAFVGATVLLLGEWAAMRLTADLPPLIRAAMAVIAGLVLYVLALASLDPRLLRQTGDLARRIAPRVTSFGLPEKRSLRSGIGALETLDVDD